MNQDKEQAQGIDKVIAAVNRRCQRQHEYDIQKALWKRQLASPFALVTSNIITETLEQIGTE